MRCIICDKSANHTINCARHNIELSLCTKHINECNRCDNCKINSVYQRKHATVQL